MLVITREAGQSLLIGDNIEVEIVRLAGGKVRLGITAPREVKINRKEVVQAERRLEREAMQGNKQ